MKPLQEYLMEAINESSINYDMDLIVTKPIALDTLENLKEWVEESPLRDDMRKFYEGVLGGDKKMENLFVKDGEVVLPKGTSLVSKEHWGPVHTPQYLTWEVFVKGTSYGCIAFPGDRYLLDDVFGNNVKEAW